DDEFAVFHDYTVDCRTDGSGRTQDHTLAELKTLDIGHGYTADGGASFPFRGQFFGALPSLREVLDQFPDGQFLINAKSNRGADALALLSYLSAEEAGATDRLSLFAGPRFQAAWQDAGGKLTVATRRGAKDCTIGYLKGGWFGQVPNSCREFGIAVPQGMGWLYPGWPNRIVKRAEAANARVVLIGPNTKFSTGIDTIEQFEKIPAGFDGWVSTDRIEVIGPLVKTSD
ncbi:MAG: glycerophosphodiester phosphodiesterase family protein, partial [Pseudomonadota bacterium]